MVGHTSTQQIRTPGFDVQWDRVENKTTVLVYAGGSIIALWLSSSIVGAVNAVPLVSSLLCGPEAHSSHGLKDLRGSV